MTNKTRMFLLFNGTVSVVTLVFLLVFSYQLGFAVDELGTTPAVILGGEYMNLVKWALLPVTLIIAIVSFIQLFRKKMMSKFPLINAIVSLGILAFLMKLMYNLGIASDEFNSTPNFFLGSEFMLLLLWALLPITLLVVVTSFILNKML
ncbi:MAG: hypothetical protein GX775_07180 [Erysipelothrix sp.]|nr:hypothetical protein [Erysipelothrix sp.]